MKLTTTIYSIFLIGFSGLSQLSGTTSTQLNTNCDGIDCNYSGPSILINELMISPSDFDGSMSGPSSGSDPGRGEWIELYNPNICEPVDISCYYLGNYTETEGAGGFVIPAGTIIPPAGFCMVRGSNVAPVPANLLVQNGGNVVEVVVPANVSSPGVCVGPSAFRLWFPNAGGWFAFYDSNGVPQDAVSWLGAGGANGQPCVPTLPGCTNVTSLPSYTNIPANRKTLLNIAGGFLQADRSVRRTTDGGAWGGQALPTYANCNAACIPAGFSSCTGSATVTVSGGTPPYTYAWNDSQVQTTPTATDLCAGTYSVTVTDNVGATAVFQVTIENFVPTVSVSIQPEICVDAAAVAITRSPVATAGQTGTFTGNGVSGSNFNPATAGVGNQTINYYYEDEFGCSNTANTSILVNPLPVVSISNNQSPYCVAVDTAALVLSPAGGQLTGTGVSANQFLPSTAGAGTYTLTYNYQDANGCSNSATVSVQVVNPVQPALTLPPDLCIDADTLLMAGTPAGGSYQIDGVPSNNEFIAPNEGAGNHVVTYQTTDANGCTASATDNILVHELPIVSVSIQPDICIDASPAAITVSPVAAAGQTGNITGTGVNGSNFNPATAGAGNQTITYYFENELGCSNTATDVIMVNPLPVVSISNNQSPYCIATTNANLVLSPAGGQLSGTGVSNNQFSPSQAGVGTFTLTYLFQDTNGCSNSATVNVQVIPPAPVTLTLPSHLCIDSDTVTMVANPGGGTFLIDGTPSTDQFIASNEGVGSYSIGYSVTDNNGCIASAIGTIVVHGLPALQIPLNTAYCFESGFHAVNPIPSGGTLTGNHVSGNGINLTGADPGNYTVSYSYTDQFGCTNHRDENYLVTTPLTPDYNYVTDCFQGAVLGTSVSNPNYTYHWNIEDIYEGTGNIYSLLFTDPGNYQLDFTITDNYGCSYDTTGFIVIEEGFKIENLSIANIITPNGDGINDQLILPDLMNDCFSYEILIVNRWGNLVFKMDGQENKVFDGRSQNGTELAEGVYFYQIQSDEIDCDDEKYKGFCYGNITIVR